MLSLVMCAVKFGKVVKEGGNFFSGSLMVGCSAAETQICFLSSSLIIQLVLAARRMVNVSAYAVSGHLSDGCVFGSWAG